MTVEQIYCDIADELEEMIQCDEWEWSSICSSLELEDPDKGYGIVVWCDDSDGNGKYFTVSIRRTNGNKDFENWNEIMCESTDTDSFEELEILVTKLVQRLR